MNINDCIRKKPTRPCIETSTLSLRLLHLHRSPASSSDAGAISGNNDHRGMLHSLRNCFKSLQYAVSSLCALCMLCNIHVAITSLSLLWHPRHQHSILHPNPAQPRPATTRIKSVVYLLPCQSILMCNRLKLYTMRRKGNISHHALAKIFVDVDIWYTRVGVGFMVLSLRRDCARLCAETRHFPNWELRRG